MQKELGLSQLPGYSTKALDAVCASECESTEVVSFDDFKRDVCGIGRK